MRARLPSPPGSPVPLGVFLAGPGPRRLAAWLLGVSVFATLFVSSFLGAFHQPKPHHVPVAVVAPTQAVTTWQKRLNTVAPGGFTLKRFGSLQQATTSLRGAGVDAVWIPPPLPGGSEVGGKPVARLFTASALGAAATQTTTQVFTGVGKVAGATMAVTDLVPLPPRDPLGLSSFFFSVGVFLPSFLGSMVLILLLRRIPALAMMAAIVVLAASVGLIEVTVVDAGLGALVGHFGTVLAIAVLTSLAFSAPTVALGRLAGPIGALLALLVFVVLGLPASGGPLGSAFLPAFPRILSPGLPLTNAVASVRNVSYFGGHDLGGHLGTVAIWAGAGLVVLAVLSLLEARSGRAQPTPHRSSTRAPASAPFESDPPPALDPAQQGRN